MRRRRLLTVALAVFVGGVAVGVAIVALQSGGSGRPAPVARDGRTGLARRRRARTSPRAAVSRPAQTTTTRTPPNGPAPVEAAGVVPPGAQGSFQALAATLPGQVGIAVAPLGQGPVTQLGSLQAAHAWSTMKVPVLVTLLSDDERNDQELTPAQQDDATLALEQSDNAAAEALFSRLEVIHGGLVGASVAVQGTLARSGDAETQINTAPNDEGFTTWGQSIWSNTGEVTFYRALASGCLLSPAHTSYVLELMQNVVSWERWGAGAAGYPSQLSVAFKGGWGPGATGGYQVRQTAIVGSAERGYVVSMLAIPSSGAFEDGVTMVSDLAGWARAHLRVAASPAWSCGSR